MKELRPLGEIKDCLELEGFPISYAYDDLVFIEHSPFLLKFDNNSSRTLYFYSHIEIEEDANEIFKAVSDRLLTINCTIIMAGEFNITENKNQEKSLDIHFFEKEGSNDN